jgi:outer membrane protein
MKRFLVLASVAALLAAGTSESQDRLPPESLNLEEALAIALAHHPLLERTAHEARAAEQAVREARSSYFPQIYLQGIAKDGLSGATGGLGLVGLPASPFFDKLATAVNLGFTALDFGRTSSQVKAARFTAASLASEREAERARIVWLVAATYYRCLQAEELYRIARDMLEERKLTARQAQVYFDAELRSKLDYNLARVNVSEAEAALLEAGNHRLAGYAALNQAMGVEGGEIYDMAPVALDMPPPAMLSELMAKALSARPDRKALDDEIHAAEASFDAVRAERLPRFVAVASAGYARFDDDFEGDKQWVAGVGFSVPLFTGFSLESRIEHSRERILGARAARRELLQRLRYEVQRTQLELETARGLARAAEQRAKIAEETLRLASQRYGAQLGSFLDIVEAELALASSKQAHIGAVYDFKIAEATLDYVVGSRVLERSVAGSRYVLP